MFVGKLVRLFRKECPVQLTELYQWTTFLVLVIILCLYKMLTLGEAE